MSISRCIISATSQADVTEGSGGIWERLHYNWSDPNRVVLTTTDSNVWDGASGHTYTFTRRPDGTTDIDVVVVRDGKNLKGWILGFVLGTIGRGVLERAFENSVKAIEIRNGALITAIGSPHSRQTQERPRRAHGDRGEEPMELTVAKVLIAFAGAFLICFMKGASAADTPLSASVYCRGRRRA